MIDRTEDKNPIKVAVLCINKSGDREFFYSSPEVTQEEYDSGDHYDLAIEAAEDQGLEAIKPFDEKDYAAHQLQELAAWMATDDPENTSDPVETLLETTARDWRLSDSHTESEMEPAHLGEYSVKVEHNKHSSLLYLSVYPSVIDGNASIPQFGLNAMIEIRDGVPAISIGVNPDENLIHVVSDTSNCLAVIPESQDNTGDWAAVPFVEKRYPGYCFKVEGFDVLEDMRRAAAEKAFAGYDFGDDEIVGDSGWSVSGEYWEKQLFIENPAGGDSIKKEFKVVFAERLPVPVEISY